LVCAHVSFVGSTFSELAHYAFRIKNKDIINNLFTITPSLIEASVAIFK